MSDQRTQRAEEVHNDRDTSEQSSEAEGYIRFGAMIITSMVVMFAIMYLNTYQLSHVEWSETRSYMTLLMGAGMAVVMLSFMWGMHHNRKLNIGIYVLATVVFVGALWLVRSQTTVGDTSYMRAMIPHHSIAVLTSSRAGIEDARVRELADEIISSQCREIAEMKWLVDDIDQNGLASDDEAQQRPVPELPDRC
jgi:hypothetical protein